MLAIGVGQLGRRDAAAPRCRGITVPRILVADDNANIQRMVVLAFQERGIDVTTVGNGEAAVRRLPDLNPDLVLADVFMPVRNGYEVCEFVKKDPRFAHIPVILLVGAFDPLDEKEARRVGADGVLKKPFVPPDPLIAMVMSALEKNPKLVAEVANAKKAATEPVSTMPLEGHSSTKLKPVPDFPEASAEDERPSYGFEKNARALEDNNLDRGSRKPIAPAAETDEDEVSGETAHKKWRRTAMDFEIPVEDASRPALSPDEHLDSAMFPSERDVPPRHIRMRDVESESENDAQTTVWHSAETTSMAEAPPVIEAPLPDHDAGEVAKLPVLAVVSTEPPRSEPPMQIPVPEAHTEAVAEESKPVVHWMDMMAPLPSAPLSSDWMSALKASAVPEKHPLSPAIPAATIPAVVEPAVGNVESSSDVVASPSLPAAQVAAPSETQ
jgi:CheY-like chemotaxis protein